MADIGTDHGFLPLFLCESGISPKVVMCDISAPSLNKARRAFADAGIDECAHFREGDGLEVLEAGEVDTVVIAGMGGILITEILGKDPEKTASFRKYILQPRNNAGFLRYWLTCKGFRIAKNMLVREGKFICEVITAFAPKIAEWDDLSASDEASSPDDPAWDLPDNIDAHEKSLVKEFALLKISQEEKKLAGLKKANNTDAEEIKKTEANLYYMRRYLDDQI